MLELVIMHVNARWCHWTTNGQQYMVLSLAQSIYL